MQSSYELLLNTNHDKQQHLSSSLQPIPVFLAEKAGFEPMKIFTFPAYLWYRTMFFIFTFLLPSDTGIAELPSFIRLYLFLIQRAPNESQQINGCEWVPWSAAFLINPCQKVTIFQDRDLVDVIQDNDRDSIIQMKSQSKGSHPLTSNSFTWIHFEIWCVFFFKDFDPPESKPDRRRGL